MRFSRSLAVLAVALVGLTGVVCAQEIPVDTWYCGIKLTVPGTYNMTNDINCSSGGIAIEVAGAHITLNLQGHVITGPSKGGVLSIGIQTDQQYEVITGPGKIKGFYSGIRLSPAGLVHISHVQIEGCFTYGIEGGGGASAIMYSTVRSAGPFGINLYGNTNSVIGNLITGATSYGLVMGNNGGAVVRDNVLAGNVFGMYLNGASVVVSGNSFTGNSVGAQVKGGSGTISGNHFDGNTNFGLWADSGSFVIQSNTADNNKAPGINLTGVSNSSVSLNTAIGNGTFDIQWDGNGSGNTWANNNCDMWTVNMGDKPCVF